MTQKRMHVGWLNPALGSRNTGDEIIADAVGTELDSLGLTYTEFSTRRPWTPAERKIAKRCSLFFLGGTNILSSEPQKYRQWIFGLKEAAIMRRKVVLVGVGWWQYQSRPNAIARSALRWLLSPSVSHSVRDSYTKCQLERLEHRILMTSCPTTWNLDGYHCVPVNSSGRIVATITDYLRDPTADAAMLTALKHRAANLTVWPQGKEDAPYIHSLGFGAYLTNPDLSTFDELMRSDNVCYIGTRLHAGIRAMQFRRPALIVAIDNRAAEMGADIGFYTVARRKLSQDPETLWRAESFDIHLPHTNIVQWRSSVRDAIASAISHTPTEPAI